MTKINFFSEPTWGCATVLRSRGFVPVKLIAQDCLLVTPLTTPTLGTLRPYLSSVALINRFMISGFCTEGIRNLSIKCAFFGTDSYAWCSCKTLRIHEYLFRVPFDVPWRFLLTPSSIPLKIVIFFVSSPRGKSLPGFESGENQRRFRGHNVN